MILSIPDDCRIKIPTAFRNEFQYIRPDWGPIGEVVFMRTYSAQQEDGSRERWLDTTIRNSEGHFTLLKRHAMQHDCWWSDEKAQRMMIESATRQFQFKWTPAGRGLQFMGTKTMEAKGAAVGMSCAFFSTKDIGNEFSEPFCRMFDFLMLGVGVGFDDRGVGCMTPQWSGMNGHTHVVQDTREGWADALRKLLEAFDPKFSVGQYDYDFSMIRAKGTPMKLMGGLASGPEPLIRMLTQVSRILRHNCDGPITATTICDMMNVIGACVVSGGIRRSSQIFLGNPTEEFMSIKDQTELTMLRALVAHPHTAQDVVSAAEKLISDHPMITHRWASNNSIFANFGMDYSAIAERIAHNGEPGLLWLDDMVRPFGRTGDPANWADRDVLGANPCVPAGTRILTRAGYCPIESRVGLKTDIWNGEQWSEVTPKITGQDQPLLRVALSDGTSLTCTDYHEWLVVEGRALRETRVKARDLIVGDSICKYTMPVVEGGSDWGEAYAHGFFCGDGQQGPSNKGILLYGEKRKLADHLATLGGRVSDADDAYARRYVGLPLSLPSKFVVRHDLSVRARLDWLAGLLDSDGTVLQNPKSVCVQVSSVRSEFLVEVRLLLTTLGVQAKVTEGREAGMRLMPDGHGGEKEYPCQTIYRLLINASDTHHLVSLGLSTLRLDLPLKKPQRDARRFVTVESVEKFGVADVVYCFDEPLAHRGTFEGIVTGQCSEQPLFDLECCNLSELYLPRHESLEDWLATIKCAFLYSKAMTLADIHDPKVDAVCKQNRRIGLSITGVAAMHGKLGSRELARWLDTGYAEVLRLDTMYSGWLGVPLSIKHTSVKPSGSVSTLPGIQGGIRYPEDRHYMRLVRFADTDPSWSRYEAAGYKVEDDVAVKSTKVVYFPVEESEFTQTIRDVSLREQVALGALVQRHWADNMVSATYMVKEHERGDIKRVLQENEGRFKSMSFLPVQKKGSYAQMPYTPCTQDEYASARSRCSPVTYRAEEGGFETQKFCDGDLCLSPSQ